MALNLHHLELFYYVAKHGGIIKACREMPYGIQQPAVSSQLLKLEEDLGVPLFQRRPFALTDTGKALYAEIAPFFGGLSGLEQRLKHPALRPLRLAGPGELLSRHVPGLLHTLKKSQSGLRVQVREAAQQRALLLLQEGEVDLAVGVRENSLPPGFQEHLLIRLPLALFAKAGKSKAPAKKRIAELLESKPPLIALEEQELPTRRFRQWLQARETAWPTSIEANSGAQILGYVEQGLGVGLWVRPPSLPVPKGIDTLILPGHEPLEITATWRGKLPPIAEQFLELLKDRAEELKD